jgi:hypothetical protein
MKTDTHDRLSAREGSGALGQIRPGITPVDVHAIQKRARALRDEWIRKQAKAFWRVVRIAFRRVRRRARTAWFSAPRPAMKR